MAISPASVDPIDRWRRRFWILFVAVIIVNVACSFGTVRGILIQPLVVHDPNARGEIAYVMADGPAYWERLIAASDLYHMHRVEQIYVLEELQSSGYNFVRRANDTRVQRAIDFLSDRGVPLDVIRTVPLHQATWFSSYDEAVGVSNLPRQFESVVVVTSAPHTRRSTLCFHRVFDSRATIATFAATPADGSVETHWPIWIEYVKLAVYWLAV